MNTTVGKMIVNALDIFKKEAPAAEAALDIAAAVDPKLAAAAAITHAAVPVLTNAIDHAKSGAPVDTAAAHNLAGLLETHGAALDGLPPEPAPEKTSLSDADQVH